ncbi:hypothetical protein GCM10009585_00120 [Brevibacterium paucivorans]
MNATVPTAENLATRNVSRRNFMYIPCNWKNVHADSSAYMWKALTISHKIRE